jgi:hypothetical protein
LELCWKLNDFGIESSSGRRKWLTAKVTGYNAINYLHTVKYVLDGEIEELNLVQAQRDWRLLPNGF